MVAADEAQPMPLQKNSAVWPSERNMTDTGASLSQSRTDASSGQALDLDLHLDRMPHDIAFDIFQNPSVSADTSSWFLEPLGLIGQPLSGEDFLEFTEVATSSQMLYSQPRTHRHLSERSGATVSSHSTSSSRRGFSLEQSDPVEAKCAAIRSLLQTSDPACSESVVATCMTRSKILLCHQLYGTHFQYHFPILHSPTHRFTEASPLLLLAMILAGAHYSTNIMEPSDLSKFAVRLLMVVQTQPVGSLAYRIASFFG